MERLFRVGELAEAWGVSPWTLYDWAKAGKIPHVKLNGALRFPEHAVTAWLAQHRRPVATAPATETAAAI